MRFIPINLRAGFGSRLRRRGAMFCHCTARTRVPTCHGLASYNSPDQYCSDNYYCAATVAAPRVRSPIPLYTNRIDLISYSCPWSAVVAVGVAAPFGFRVIYPRFMTIDISCRSICAAAWFAIAIPMGGTPESSCGTVFMFHCQSQYIVTPSIVAISMDATDGGSHGTRNCHH
jgi:hypothetical protein